MSLLTPKTGTTYFIHLMKLGLKNNTIMDIMNKWLNLKSFLGIKVNSVQILLSVLGFALNGRKSD